MSNDVVIVDNQRMTEEEFRKYKEELERDNSKRLKEIIPGTFRTLSRVYG